MVLVNALRTIKKTTLVGRQGKKKLAVIITPPCLWNNSGVLVLSDNASFRLLQGVLGNMRNILNQPLPACWLSHL